MPNAKGKAMKVWFTNAKARKQLLMLQAANAKETTVRFTTFLETLWFGSQEPESGIRKLRSAVCPRTPI